LSWTASNEQTIYIYTIEASGQLNPVLVG